MSRKRKSLLAAAARRARRGIAADHARERSADQIYDLTVLPATLQPGTSGQTLTATFKNDTSSGNSTINSLKLFADAPPDSRSRRLRA